MRTQSRLFLAGGALVVGLWALAASDAGRAADPKDARAGVLKVADLYQKKDADAAKAAQDIAKDAELEDVMNLMQPRAKKGLGIGPRAGVVSPDAIEAFIVNLEKRAPAKAVLDKSGPDLERMAYVTAAIGAIAAHKSPVKAKEGKKDPKDWVKWSDEMRDASLELADAFKAKNPSAIKKAGKKLNESCTSCHDVFK